MHYTTFATDWGTFGFVTLRGRVVATMLPQDDGDIEFDLKQNWPDAVEDPTALPRFRKQVVDYFNGKRIDFDVAIDLSDLPPFRAEVLEACRAIPHGSTASYGDLARAVGRPDAARAVGGAMATNPVPLVIPCHRVIRSDGSFGGFSSPRGILQKKSMLALEAAATNVARTANPVERGGRKRKPMAVAGH